MDIGIVSSRYARALLKYATERGEAEAVYEGMLTLAKAFEDVAHLREALNNPVLEDEKKLHLLNTAAGEAPCESLQQFFRLTLKNRRVGMVQFMAHSYVDAYRKQQHLIHSQLTVPVDLGHETMDRLKRMVKEKTHNEVEFVVKVDPSIIGGFVMEYDTYRYDASIRSKLERMKKQLLADDALFTSKQGK